MNTHTYRVIIEPDGKYFHAYVPALPGCRTFGKTVLEARKHIHEAIAAYLEALIKLGEAIPADEGLELFETVSVPVFAAGPLRRDLLRHNFGKAGFSGASRSRQGSNGEKKQKTYA